MFQYELPIAVVTLDKKVLLPAGTLLTEQVVADVAALGRLQPREECEVLEYGTVRADLKRFQSIPPYHNIFSDQSLVDELFAEMQKVRLPLPLLKALDYFRQHDFNTYRHILMVFCLTSMLVKGVDGGTQRREANFIAGPTHDFGKISIPLHILKKTGPLTIREQQMLKYHPLTGYALLSYYLGDHRHPAVLVARDHHERRNGSGYPRGISELDPVVEMVAACDVYDALLSPRSYRPVSFDNRTALEELTRMAEGGLLGWPCVEALVACNRHGRPSADQVVVSRDVRGTPPTGNCYGMVVDEEQDASSGSGLLSAPRPG
jgi:HD-GYP domain-containing protein (c-di-GMP phosphodiesterase class II)